MRRVGKSLLVALWFMVLTLPVMGIRMDTVSETVVWQWERVGWLGCGIFLLALLWDWAFERKARGLPIVQLPAGFGSAAGRLARNTVAQRTGLVALALWCLVQPFVVSLYQTNIMITALLNVILALGLNIAVGLAGQLVLGYIAFYAVGAYAYGLLAHFWGWGFWACLPVGGFVGVIFGLILGFPVLRLRGDYLAIVTLGFGEIVRLALQNWTSLTGGPKGIDSIPRPGFFGMELNLDQSTYYIYYLALLGVIITIGVIWRLKNSRVGLALQALREDEIASEAMGINVTNVKLTAFALSSCWAGFAGVLFAARTQYINPSSFTFMESAMILAMVVLGGMGSIAGVTLAALLLILVPEYLRAFADYRMLIFGAIMVLMMLFRPQGLVSDSRRDYRVSALEKKQDGAANGGQA